MDLAEKCGIAFQLTNILRDVREDAENDRVYLPEEDLERFHVPAEELRAPQISGADEGAAGIRSRPRPPILPRIPLRWWR